MVFWSDIGAVDQRANYRAYDVAGPAVSSVTAPTAAIAGKALSFCVRDRHLVVGGVVRLVVR